MRVSFGVFFNKCLYRVYQGSVGLFTFDQDSRAYVFKFPLCLILLLFFYSFMNIGVMLRYTSTACISHSSPCGLSSTLDNEESIALLRFPVNTPKLCRCLLFYEVIHLCSTTDMPKKDGKGFFVKKKIRKAIQSRYK